MDFNLFQQFYSLQINDFFFTTQYPPITFQMKTANKLHQITSEIHAHTYVTLFLAMTIELDSHKELNVLMHNIQHIGTVKPPYNEDLGTMKITLL